MRKKNRKAKWIIGSIVAVLLCCWFGKKTVDLYNAKMKTEASIRERHETEIMDVHPDANGIVTFEGRQYKRNSAVKAILFIGVDTAGQMEKSDIVGSAGQADGIFLAAQDTTRDKVKILMIPRDTMTDITLYDLSGNSLGKDRQHLTLAFAYGDGREKSCEMVKEGVSELLGGLEIDGYMAVNTSMIAVLNDEIGGVEVTIPDGGMESRDETMVQGKTMTLHGKQAEIFVRYRDINETQTAVSRMDRQKTYMQGFLNTAKEKGATDNNLIIRLVDDVEQNMITNMTKDQYMDMGLAVLNSSQNFEEDDFAMLPGEGVETELFDEYHPDRNAVKPLVLEMFYKEIPSSAGDEPQKSGQ